MNIVNLENDKWKLEINLIGGRIENLIKEGQKILGTYNRIDGKLGNTHVCIPNFAAEGVEKFGFIFHGPFRNCQWQLTKKKDDNLEIRCQNEGLLVDQIFEIGAEFSQKIKVRNVGNEKKRVHLAVHNYWDAEFGWSGIKLNGQDVTGGFIDNPEIKLKEHNILEIKGKKVINWETKNFKQAKLWTGVKEINGQRIFDEKYVCIEPEMEYEGFVETEESWLEPKAVLITEQIIK